MRYFEEFTSFLMIISKKFCLNKLFFNVLILLPKVSEMTEVGDSINRVETLIRETGQFEKLCMVDIERSEEVIATGQHLLQVKNHGATLFLL